MQIKCSSEDSIIKIQDTIMDVSPMAQEIFAVIYGSQIHCVSAWEEICADACKSKTDGIGRPFDCFFSSIDGA